MSASRLGSDIGTYAAISGAQVTSPTGLRRWWAALGSARTAFADIACIGDSITVGAYANNTASSYTNATVEQLLSNTGWVGQLRSLFAVRYGDAGEGYIGHNDFRAVAGGGASLSAVAAAIHQTGASLATGGGQTVTYSIPACTAFDLLLWTSFGAQGASTYTVDGGSAQTIPASPATQATPYKVSATGLANTTHTVVVSAPATGGALIPYGVIVKSSATSGVRVHRIGRSGAKTTDALCIGSPTGGFPGAQPDRCYANTLGSTATNATLAVVSLGTNDAASPQTPSPTAYASNLQTFITWAAANGKCVLLVSEARRAVPNGLTYSEQDYYDQMRALAVANDHVAYLDMQPTLGTYAQVNALGLMTDTIHPGAGGHGMMANTLFDVLTRPTRYPNT